MLSPDRINAQARSAVCEDPVVINTFIKCYGFELREIDTVTVRIYKQGNHFKTATDSFRVYLSLNAGDSTKKLLFIDIGGVHPIKNNVDWSFQLKSNEKFCISDVQIGEVIERHQFKRCRMIAYKINGKQTKSGEIEIIKKGFKMKAEPKAQPRKDRDGVPRRAL